MIVGVLVLVLESISSGGNIMWLRAIRALRALRVMRAAAKAEGIRIVVASMFKAFPALGNVLLVALLFYYIFAILAMNLIGGKYWSCVDDDGNYINPLYVLPPGGVISKTWCDLQEKVVNASFYHTSLQPPVLLPAYNLSTSWRNPKQNFDNLAVAMWTLFQMASLEGWSDVMYRGADTTDIDKQPINNDNSAMNIFFILFIVVGCFFMLNLLIGECKQASSVVVLRWSEHNGVATP